MARTRDPERLDRILECATRTFIARSFRRARMSHVAEEAGLAPGTLYLYFESKEALFATVLRRAFLLERFSAPRRLPVRDPGRKAILEFIRARFAEEWRLEPVAGAGRNGAPAVERGGRVRPATRAEARREVEALIRDLYRKVDRFRFAVRVMERSALDWPELFDLHFRTMRRGVLRQLETWMATRIDQGRLRPLPHVPTAARIVLETVAWFAMHRHFAPDSATIADRDAEETVVDLLVHALIPTNRGAA